MKKYLKALLTVVILGGIVALALVLIPKKQKLTIQLENSSAGTHQAAIYAIKSDDHEYDYHQDINPKNLRQTITANTTLNLKQGAYVVVAEADKNFAAFEQRLDLNSEPQTVTVSAKFSDEKLASLLTQESPATKQAIATAYPSTATNFDIAPGKLYHQGEWYGTTIAQKDPGEVQFFSTDTFRVVLHKENGNWVVITKPPELVLTKYKYPNVPIEILKAVNDQ